MVFYLPNPDNNRCKQHHNSDFDSDTNMEDEAAHCSWKQKKVTKSLNFFKSSF